MACVPLYFLLFLPPDANALRSTSTLVSEQFAMPVALQWKGVAEIIAKGLHGLPTSALIAMGLAALAAVLIRRRQAGHPRPISLVGGVGGVGGPGRGAAALRRRSVSTATTLPKAA